MPAYLFHFFFCELECGNCIFLRRFCKLSGRKNPSACIVKPEDAMRMLFGYSMKICMEHISCMRPFIPTSFPILLLLRFILNQAFMLHMSINLIFWYRI